MFQMSIVNKLNSRSSLMVVLVSVIFLFFSFTGGSDFKKQQLANSRVKNAYNEKWNVVKHDIHAAGIDSSSFVIFPLSECEPATPISTKISYL